jgi:hypothetical protein
MKKTKKYKSIEKQTETEIQKIMCWSERNGKYYEWKADIEIKEVEELFEILKNQANRICEIFESIANTTTSIIELLEEININHLDERENQK